MSTDEDNNMMVTDVVKMKSKINDLDAETQAIGIDGMNTWMTKYKEHGNINAVDIHLLLGIYEKELVDDEFSTENLATKGKEGKTPDGAIN